MNSIYKQALRLIFIVFLSILFGILFSKTGKKGWESAHISKQIFQLLFSETRPTALDATAREEFRGDSAFF